MPKALNTILSYVKARPFVFVFLFLLASALYVGFFSLYPMAFDEDFHLGLIRIYSTSWLPYGIEHTRDMATYGLATADPSYLWHYIQSFPYRCMDWLGWSEQTIVIALRMLNTAVFMLGMWLYYKTLRFAGFGKKFSSIVLLFFALIPIVPMLAGQINYDNPLFAIVALSMLLALHIQRTLARTHSLPARSVWLLVITLLVGIAIKYAFLPIAAGVAAWLLLVLWHERKQYKMKKLLHGFYRHTLALRKSTQLLLVVGLLLSVFFTAKYVVNYAQYHSPIPDCAAVFDEDACMNYGPWARNYTYKQAMPADFQPKSFPEYIAEDWLPSMDVRLTFAVAGPTNDYQTKNPLPFVIGIFTLLMVVGFLLVLYFRHSIFRQPIMNLVLVVGTIYIGTLMLKLYGGYVKTGQPVAINGRYLLPLLPFIGAGLMLGYAYLLQKIGKQHWLNMLASIDIVALLLSGGGIITYILLAEPQWYW